MHIFDKQSNKVLRAFNHSMFILTSKQEATSILVQSVIMLVKFTKCRPEDIYIYIANEVLTVVLMWWMGMSFANSMMIIACRLLFIFGAVFLKSSDGDTVTTSEPRTVNERPIIGILSQEQHYALVEKYSKENFKSYIAASYVKSVEASGARVVPIMIGKSRDYYKDLLGKINGVLLPGGATWFNQSNGYADAGQHIYDIAQELNDAGDYFPVFGTCLGFELLVILASGRGQPENRAKCRAFGNDALNLTKDYRSSKLFSRISNEDVNVLVNEASTINVHQFCILDENIQRFNLTQDWRVSSHSYDENGKKFISSIEHRRYPFYGVQFHPEKTAFEWKAEKSYVHSVRAIKANRYFIDFFVEECRKNIHRFRDKSEENEYLIYNYEPYFTGLHGSDYTQCYFFETQGLTKDPTDERI